jgi:type II secretory pathway predicted ATPase ExeA
MYGEMMQYYGLVKDFDKTDFFETEAFKSVLSSLEILAMSGGIIALTGIVGIGKTKVMRHFKDELKKNNQVIVVKSLATDKHRVNINTLYASLFADLPTAKDFKAPTQTEIRERKLQELIRKINKPIVFFIDGAHDLHWRTLIGIKQLIETVEDAKGILTIIMVGHPKLGNDLNRPAMEEIGARAKLVSPDSWGQQKQKYIEWVLTKCSKPKTQIYDILTPDAINLLAERLITPLQICHYLTRALIKGTTTGTKPVDVEIIEAVLSPDLNTLETKLAREGYNITALCEYLNAKRSEIKAYFNGQLPAARADEFNKEIHKLGII